MLWYNGQLIKDDRIAFDLGDRGLLLGDGLFETLVSFNGIPFLLREHLDRMMEAASRIALPLDRAALENAVHTLAQANPEPAVIRLTATRGSGPRGLDIPRPASPMIFATRAPWNPRLAFGETTLGTVSIRRNPTSPTSSMKTLAYLDPVLGLKEAQQRGAKDALFLSPAGSLACTSMANLFILKDYSLLTPAADGAILNGIMRRLMLPIAASSGLVVEERTCSPDELHDADLVFTTNSVRLMTRVIEVDQTPLRNPASDAWLGLKRHLTARIADACNSFTFND
jgi:branched-chain amino acid aminotransferase